MKSENGVFNTRWQSWIVLPVCLLLCVLLYFAASWLGERRFEAELRDIGNDAPDVRENAPEYNRLTAKEQIVYRAMEAAVNDGWEESAVFAFVPTADEFDRARTALIFDQPELWQLDEEKITLRTSEHTGAVKIGYGDTSAERKGAVEAAISKILASLPEEPYQKALCLHDALCSIAVTADEDTETVGKTAADVLLGVPSDARAYALAYRLLCMRAGIGCEIVSGKANGQAHIWNYVNLGEHAGYIDVFWDDTCVPSVDLPLHGYYFLSGEDMAKTHTPDTARETKDPVSYYDTFSLVTSCEELPAYLETVLRRKRDIGGESVEFLLTDAPEDGEIGEAYAQAAAAVNADGIPAGMASSAAVTEARKLSPECRVYRVSEEKEAYTLQIFYVKDGE